MIYRNLFFASVIITFFSSCFLPEGWSGWTARPFWGMKNLPPATNDYGRGFEHGCRQGLYVTSKGILVEKTSDAGLNVEELVNNDQFAAGYWDGMEQCTYIQDWDVI